MLIVEIVLGERRSTNSSTRRLQRASNLIKGSRRHLAQSIRRLQPADRHNGDIGAARQLLLLDPEESTGGTDLCGRD